MAAPIVSGGSRREINIVCSGCDHHSQVPPSAVLRNNFFCSGCGKSLDLSQVFRQFAGEGNTGTQMPRRDKSDSKYKSARKARR